MDASESSNDHEAAPSAQPVEKSRRELLSFIIFSIIEETVIGSIAFLILILLFPSLVLLGTICIAIGLGIFTIVKIRFYLSSARVPVDDSMVGQLAVARSGFQLVEADRWEGSVRVRGEIWRAFADEMIPRGVTVQIIAVKGLRLHVTRTQLPSIPSQPRNIDE